MSVLLDKLLEDDGIKTILSDSLKRKILSEINFTNKSDSEFDSKKLIRVFFLLINHCFSEVGIDKKKLDIAHSILKSLSATDEKQLNDFAEICGISGVDNELLYYFYLAVISVHNDRIINIRIDLLDYSENSLKNQSDIWKDRFLNKILNAFIFLSRKKNGFEDIRKGIKLVDELKNEQSEFEKQYIESFSKLVSSDIREFL